MAASTASTVSTIITTTTAASSTATTTEPPAIPLPVFAGVGGASGVWRKLKIRKGAKKKKKKKKTIWFWKYEVEFTPFSETFSVEEEKRITFHTSSEHRFDPVTVQIDKEAARHFKISLDVGVDFYSKTKAIQKDDNDVLMALSMIIGKD